MSYYPSVNFVGARKGATGTLDDLKSNAPVPKSWVNSELVDGVYERLKENQTSHSRLNLAAILQQHFFDSESQRLRVVWSKHMITSAGVSKLKVKGQQQLFLHFRDGEEERKDNQRWMRQVLENLYKKGGRVQEAVEDFLYLTFVHEASELQQRKTTDTLAPDIKAEVRAEIEEAKAYFSLPPERRKILKQLYEMLDATDDPRKKIFSKELELFEEIGQFSLGTIDGLLELIKFVVETPDYARESNLYHDDRTRLQLARSLFVDILHDFSGSTRADAWVRTIESAGLFAEQPVSFNYSENSAALSEKAEEVLCSAARTLETLRVEESEATIPPTTKLKKRVIDNFNKKIHKLDPLKQQLALNEVLSVPDEFIKVLEDNSLNRYFSYMDDVGIYHSLNLSRLDLRGLNLNSGDDERSAIDIDRKINYHKDKRTDLRGAHLVASDLSQRSNFSAAQMEFVIAPYSNFCEAIFTRTKAIGMVLYGANANEGQFERANMTAVDARGMSASFARIQMKETDINGMKVWQSDVPAWQRAYVDISEKIALKEDEGDADTRESLKAELDFLDDSFLDELDAMDEADGFQSGENWIELREVDGQLDFLKGRGIVFYSREESLEYSVSPHVVQASSEAKIA